MTDERRQRILQIADELEQEGAEATNSSVYSRALGHRGDVVTVMKARRAERNGGGVAVLEEEDEIPPPSARELEEDLAQLTASYDAWHLALERLWDIELEGPLSEQNFSRKQWLEYQMVQNLQAQERLRPQLELAKLTEAVERARQTHDALVPTVTAQAEAVVEAVGTLTEALAALRQGFTAQVDAFFPFRDRRGQQAFDVEGGETYVGHLVQLLFPADFRAKELVDLLLRNPVTHGRAQDALANCPRLRPFSPRAITRYLEGAAS